MSADEDLDALARSLYTRSILHEQERRTETSADLVGAWDRVDKGTKELFRNQARAIIEREKNDPEA